MKRNPIQNLILLLCLCTSIIGLSQAPEADIDSVTQDSYQRMLERRTSEQESDSVLINQTQIVLQEQRTKEWQWYYYLAVISGTILLLAVLWYLRRTSGTKGGLKE